jgi:hypothetical protein
MLGGREGIVHLEERLAESLDDVKLGEGHVIVVEGSQEEDVLAADLVLGREATCRERKRPHQSSIS